MELNHELFEAIILAFPDAVVGKLFGKPSGNINKKAFVVFYEDEMVFKVGRDEVPFLIQKYEGAKNFDPSKKNRPMKDWIQVPAIYKSDWKELAEQAMEYYKSSS